MHYKNVIFSAEEVRGKEFEHDLFIHCIFTGCDLKFTNFTNCEFSSCDFTGSLPDITGIAACKFPESKLSFLNFSTSLIKACDFSSSLLQECLFQQLKAGSKSERKKFDLSGCCFENTNLRGTAFIFCILKDVPFVHADLTRVVFEKCNLTQADLTGADLTGTNFDTSDIKKRF